MSTYTDFWSQEVKACLALRNQVLVEHNAHRQTLKFSVGNKPGISSKNGMAHIGFQFEGFCLSLHDEPGADPVKVISLGPSAARGGLEDHVAEELQLLFAHHNRI